MTKETNTSPGTGESTKDNLAGEISVIVGKTADQLKDTTHSVVEEISAARNAITENACGAAAITQGYVRANPWKIIGMAVAAGLVIGTLIRRR